MQRLLELWSALNLATRLTLSRLLLLLPLIGLAFIDGVWPMQLSLLLMCLAAATDYADGWVARRFDQHTPLGAMLDQIIDKMLVLGVLVALLAADKLSWAATTVTFIILLREILVSGLRESLALENVPVPVSAISKWKTASQMGAIILLYAAQCGFTPLAGTLDFLAEAAIIAAGALTLYTAWDYAKVALNHYT